MFLIETGEVELGDHTGISPRGGDEVGAAHKSNRLDKVHAGHCSDPHAVKLELYGELFF
jgi:hypothetical protein